MNDERDERPRGDKAVARAYRELATERTPATVNEQVLRAAAREAGRGYPRWIGWLRPLAWAATVGLTLAIVLELGDIPAPDDDLVSPARPEETREAPPADDAPSENARREIDSESADGRAAGRARNDGDRTPASAAFAVDDAAMLEQAADIAAVRAGSESREQAPAAPASAKEAEPGPACDDGSRERADTWYRCIERLRAEGNADAAEREFDELIETFPDFEPPR